MCSTAVSSDLQGALLKRSRTWGRTNTQYDSRQVCGPSRPCCIRQTPQNACSTCLIQVCSCRHYIRESFLGLSVFARPRRLFEAHALLTSALAGTTLSFTALAASARPRRIFGAHARLSSALAGTILRKRPSPLLHLPDAADYLKHMLCSRQLFPALHRGITHCPCCIHCSRRMPAALVQNLLLLGLHRLITFATPRSDHRPF